jgi:hypothetical protein
MSVERATEYTAYRLHDSGESKLVSPLFYSRVEAGEIETIYRGDKEQ